MKANHYVVEMGTDSESGSGVRLYFSDPDLSFREMRIRYVWYGMVYRM